MFTVQHSCRRLTWTERKIIEYRGCSVSEEILNDLQKRKTKSSFPPFWTEKQTFVHCTPRF